VNALIFTGALIGIPALLAVTAIWRGYVLSILWGWFAVPAFGLPTLSIPLAIGLALIVGYLTADSTLERKRQGFGAAMAVSLLGPAFVLLVGWIVSRFV
jgi:hypothetical protein